MKDMIIKKLNSNETCKYAADWIRDWKLDENKYPEIKERLMKKSMRYYVGRYLYTD